jgi:hypothetical protein
VTTVGFLHVAAEHMQAARRLVAEHAPGIVDVHLVDERLLEPTEDALLRLKARIGELMGRDIDALVCTCPSLISDAAHIAAQAGLAAVGLPELAARAVPGLTSGAR